MSPSLVGSLGVGLLLLAFVLNLAGRLYERSAIYLLMNILGAGMAAWYAWQGDALPFVILETVWGVAALVRLLALTKKAPADAGA